MSKVFFLLTESHVYNIKFNVHDIDITINNNINYIFSDITQKAALKPIVTVNNKHASILHQ